MVWTRRPVEFRDDFTTFNANRWIKHIGWGSFLTDADLPAVTQVRYITAPTPLYNTRTKSAASWTER